MDKNNSNKVLIVMGPSGVGKDTLVENLKKKVPGKFVKGVTHTTRPIREGEKEGINYYYVSKEKFLDMNNKGELIENNFYNNNYYGLSKASLMNSTKQKDKITYAIIDINGANSVHKLGIPAVFVGVLPKDEETLKIRLKGRGTETEEVIKGRLETAKEEIKRIKETKFINYIIINDDFNKATDDLYTKLKKEYNIL